jgi:myo-inositol-1(or 4)-monophosphatase
LHSTAIGAGRILTRYFEKVHHIERKAGAGIVTEADKFAEDFILKKILRKYPKSSIITEESGEFGGDSLCWYIDPLDGTSNYAHGFPWFCVSIGVYEEGEARAGVIYHPITEEMFYAEAGQGAFLNRRRLRVSATAEIEDSLLGTGFFYTTGERLRADMEIFNRVQQKALGVRRPGSAALDLACVASGRYDGFWERGLKPWDTAAGFLLVREAGGTVTGYRGQQTTPLDAEIVATNGVLHDSILNLIQG